MNKEKSTLVVGASEKDDRYSYKAMMRLQEKGYKVLGFGRKLGKVGEAQITNQWPQEKSFHTITLYVNPKNQVELYKSILESKPQRVIMNPGTQNDKFRNMLQAQNIEVEYACTLVMLSLDQY